MVGARDIDVWASAGFVRLFDRYAIIGHSFFIMSDSVPLTPCTGFQTDMLNQIMHPKYETVFHDRSLFIYHC